MKRLPLHVLVLALFLTFSGAGTLASPTDQAVRGTLDDVVFVHLGFVGSSAVLRAPDGALMAISYVPSIGTEACLIQPTIPPRFGCPIVAEVNFRGEVLHVRQAYDPTAVLPDDVVLVRCVTRTNLICLEDAAADLTWTLIPALNDEHQPAGMLVKVAGKVFNDVSGPSGSIETDGSGKASRSALAYARIWNWQEQPSGTEYDACSDVSIQLCNLGGPPEEDVTHATFYLP